MRGIMANWDRRGSCREVYLRRYIGPSSLRLATAALGARDRARRGRGIRFARSVTCKMIVCRLVCVVYFSSAPVGGFLSLFVSSSLPLPWFSCLRFPSFRGRLEARRAGCSHWSRPPATLLSINGYAVTLAIALEPWFGLGSILRSGFSTMRRAGRLSLSYDVIELLAAR